MNSVRAGQVVSVKFGLGGDQGLDVLAAGSPTSHSIDCASGTVTGEVVPAATVGNSGLTYDPESAQYTYLWKTDRAWSTSCRQLVVGLDDGSTHRANFVLR
ncbi:MAG: PxKF domain-containing protein, partial [Actinomycetota bacterium]|nr:PxKF domain-containing protein [Actinomycetota bacterium]